MPLEQAKDSKPARRSTLVLIPERCEVMLVFFTIDVVEQYQDGRENREHKEITTWIQPNSIMALPPYKAVLSSKGSSKPTMEMIIPEIKTPPAPISLCTNELTVPATPLLYGCSVLHLLDNLHTHGAMNTNPSAPSEDMVHVCTSSIHHRRSDPFSGNKFVPYDRSSNRRKTVEAQPSQLP